MNKPPLLVSACLLGQPVRYDGHGKAMPSPLLFELARRYQLLSICPECQGGLPTPRPAAEISGGDGGDGGDVLDGRARVITQTGQDVSRAFIDGARQALDSAIRHGCRQALLKANSPSCGNRQIHSGRFDQQLQPGSGVTAALLQGHGISVFNENEMDRLLLTKPQP
ncbi:uncharacterized protein YbbK (DUF523 family) [Vogesella indigofera]|uniref:Uncharacterized protein YbbK (DUF523 family) n=2 Tax=Vogesella indigofera TaxID=45465 RepID=A0A495BKJ8_VOGIN|nr:uncharacterized protein YbbK (DUF523 family) [Vogesella indigofera]